MTKTYLIADFQNSVQRRIIGNPIDAHRYYVMCQASGLSLSISAAAHALKYVSYETWTGREEIESYLDALNAENLGIDFTGFLIEVKNGTRLISRMDSVTGMKMSDVSYNGLNHVLCNAARDLSILERGFTDESQDEWDRFVQALQRGEAEIVFAEPRKAVISKN
jgi:hypothetical protein